MVSLFSGRRGPRFILIFLAVVSVLVLLKHNTLQAPFHWDVMGFAVPAAENIHDDGVFIPERGSTGHPPLFLAVLALAWKIFGKTLFVSHFVNIVFAALGLTCLFFLAHRLYGGKAAMASLVLLLFNQTFFTQAGIVYLAVPLMFTAILTVHAYIQRKHWLYLISAASMLLVKETALIVLGSIILFDFLENVSKKERILSLIKRSAFLALPAVPLAAWFLAHYLTAGYIFKINRVFINTGSYFVIFINNFIKNYIYDASIENVNRTNWIILICIILFLAVFKTRKLRYEKLFLLIIILNVMLFSITDDLPRYFLVTFPFFLLTGARAAVYLTEKAKMKGKNFLLPAVIVLYAGLSVLNFHGTRQTDGWRLESNMEYLDMVRLHVKVCEFIQKKHESDRVMTNYPLNIALRKPWYGYVDKPLRVINFRPLEKTEDTIIVWSEQSNFGHVVNFMNENRQRLRQVREFSYRGKRVIIYKFAQPSE